VFLANVGDELILQELKAEQGDLLFGGRGSRADTEVLGERSHFAGLIV